MNPSFKEIINNKNPVLMNPKKNPLWNISKDISTKYYKILNSFERIEGDKFIENPEELKKIGDEIFDDFIKNKPEKYNLKIKLFADICAAPGVYSEIVLDRFDTKGIGISLPIEQGGVDFSRSIKSKDHYKMVFKDILEKKYYLDIPKKLDLGMASCVSYQNDPKNAFTINIKLILTSLQLLLSNLETGGCFIINLTMKNLYFAFNLVNLLSSCFNNFRLWKSQTVWGTKNTFYFFGYDFKGYEYYTKISNDLESIKNSPLNSVYLNKLESFQQTDNNSQYKKIEKHMKEIYLVKIIAMLELLN